MGIVLDMAAKGSSVFQDRITDLIEKWQGSPVISGPEFTHSFINLNQNTVNGQNYPLHDQASPLLRARIELVPDSTPSSPVKSIQERRTPDSMEYRVLERGVVPVQLAHPQVEVRVPLADRTQVALEVAVVHRVEADLEHHSAGIGNV